MSKEYLEHILHGLAFDLASAWDDGIAQHHYPIFCADPSLIECYGIFDNRQGSPVWKEQLVLSIGISLVRRAAIFFTAGKSYP
jgi:hypothetical protein